MLRWQDESDGWISPADFVPVAEESGLIVPIGEWIIETAIEQCRKWQDAGFDKISVAINLSGRQFQNGDLAELIEQTLNNHQIAPSILSLK